MAGFQVTTEAETALKYQSESPGKVKGMLRPAIDAIDATEPYGGGNGQIIYQLHCLDKVDKHRLLLPVLTNLLDIL